METARSQELTLIDERGCLADEVLFFVDELDEEQRTVVQRHLGGCLVCAHQQAELSRAARQVRQMRPRAPLSADVRLLSRQAVLRSILRQSESRERYAERGTKARRRRLMTTLGLITTGLLVLAAAAVLIWA